MSYASAKNPMAMHNLTLASAKHLVSMGHITKAHHASIVKKSKSQIAPIKQIPTSTGPGLADEAPATAFGSLQPRMGAGAGHYMGSMPEEGQ